MVINILDELSLAMTSMTGLELPRSRHGSIQRKVNSKSSALAMSRFSDQPAMEGTLQWNLLLCSDWECYQSASLLPERFVYQDSATQLDAPHCLQKQAH